MNREFSAGGVLVRRLRGRWVVAMIRPRRPGAPVWALPKGHVEPDESAEATAVREVEEETGASGSSLGKLGDVRYVYSFRGERIFKVVSFFLLRYVGGRLGSLAAEFEHEVAEVRWLPLEDAPRLLTYPSEREMAKLAMARLQDDGL